MSLIRRSFLGIAAFGRSIHTKALAPDPRFLNALDTMFPRSLEMHLFHAKTATVLQRYGYHRGGCIAMVSVCRDELTRSFVEAVDELWGNSFSISSIAGMVFCGATGFSAAFHHAPVDARCGAERYVFFVGPHIAIGADGEVGKIFRPGRPRISNACGSLCAVLKELEDGKVRVRLDPKDIEQSMVKQQILESLKYGEVPTLDKITKVAHNCIVNQVEDTLASLNLAKNAQYAFVSGVQIHGPMGSNFFWPQQLYIKEGEHRLELLEEVQTAEVADLMNHHNRLVAAKQLFHVAHGDTEAVTAWLSSGGDPNAADVDGRTALHIACTYGKAELVKMLIDAGANLSIPDRWGYRPIDSAVTNGHDAIADVLLERGCRMHDKFAISQVWASIPRANVEQLHRALKYARPEIVNCRDYLGRTPLALSIGLHQPGVVKTLLDAGADMHIKDHNGKSPWTESVQTGSQFVALLQQYAERKPVGPLV